MNIALYLIKANIFLIAFGLIYQAFLRRETFFQLNRFYLITAAVLSLVIPLFEFESIAAAAGNLVVFLPEFIAGSSDAAAGTSSFSWALLLQVIYTTGAAYVAVQILKGLWQVRALRNRYPARREDDVVIVQTHGELPTFSFFHYLFWGSEGSTEDTASIMKHELVHIRQRHSIDLLFFESIRLVFWYNPIAWWGKKAVAENHEYIADASVLEYSNQTDYSVLLLSQTFGVTPTGITHSFNNQSLLKRRITMMNKKPSTPIAKLKYLMLVPMIGGMLWVSSCAKDGTDKTIPPPPPIPESGAVTSDDLKVVDGMKVHLDVDKLPEFPGGKDALYTYLGNNIKYPDAAKEAGIEGKVIVEFTITKEGEIENVVAKNALGGGLDIEAVNVIGGMPNWVPAMKDGEAVAVQFTMPIAYQLAQE
jgi:TonB family protein